MKTHYLIPNESGLTGIDHELAVALTHHREVTAHGRVFTFSVGHPDKLTEVLLSTTHRETALALAAMPDKTRRLIHQKLIERVFMDNTTTAMVAIEPPSEERAKPQTFQVVHEVGSWRDVFHFNPVK